MTQEQRVLKYMEQHGSITGREAVLNLGIMSLTKVISDMRRQGLPIKSEWKQANNRYNEKTQYKEYRLEKEA